LFKQQPLRKKHAWPSQIIREPIRFVHENANGDEILIEIQVVPPILVEQIQIQEVLINSYFGRNRGDLSNAQPPHLLIVVTLVNESELLIEVIDLKDTQSILGAFVTTRYMGMGLAVSRSII
jgi:phosphoglycerate-specific signal transduction histidine kinase